MPIRARSPCRTVALQVRLAYGPRVRDPEALRREEERAEGEAIAWILVFEDLLCEVVSPLVGVWRDNLSLHGGDVCGGRVCVMLLPVLLLTWDSW
jgi:hypothetical protein